jgi:hypothetical protein
MIERFDSVDVLASGRDTRGDTTAFCNYLGVA